MDGSSILKVGEEILLNIKRIGINGEGIGYYKRLCVFVDGALPSEDVVCVITKIFPKYAYAKLVKIKVTSSYRVEPVCPYYNLCGGCSMQHMSYEYELKCKQNIVKESFDNYYDQSLDDKVFKNIISSPNELKYRAKTKMPVRYDGENLVTGMYEADTNKLVYIDNCLVEDKFLRFAVKDILKYLTESQVIAFNLKSKTGILRHLIVRRSSYTHDCQVTLILYKNDERTIHIAKGLTKIDYVTSVYVSINPDLEGNETLGSDTFLVAGSSSIKENILDKTFEIYPESYFTLNIESATNMYKYILDIAKLSKNELVCDAYCGIGTIGLLLANNALEVRGLDNNKSCIKSAINNAKLNNIDNATFYNGEIVSNLSKYNHDGWVPDLLILNPPKNGLDLRMINFLQNVNIKRLIYVSSNTSTLAKNLNHLAKNYKILSIQPFDLYPKTKDVEAVVELIRK